MSTHKHLSVIGLVSVVVALIIAVVFMFGEQLGITPATKTMGYENRIFDTSYVHSLEITIDDWDGFLATCQQEQYSVCSLTIDGETYANVGIRGKGNTSLSTVSAMNSERYSFKVEFDQYDNTKSYHGLDKLSLNNIIQDNTYMKDYLTYRMMGEFGAVAPLCSFTYITVNGEDWGLYLAVEGIEDSFLQRNYGSDYGELYKPDSMSFGGGRGNGIDFNFEDFNFEDFNMPEFNIEDFNAAAFNPESFGGTFNIDNFDPSSFAPDNFDGGSFAPGNMPSDFGDGSFDMGNIDINNLPAPSAKPDSSTPPSEEIPTTGTAPDDAEDTNKKTDRGGFQMFGMGSSDVKLQYIDDDPASYSNIFNNAKTDITDADKSRLITSLQALSNNENIDKVVNIDEVIRYFVVHNFVCNGDSYTGSMIHNYYLYEENGMLSMIPWDYNLAYGTFQSSDATNTVNTPIETPVSGGTGQDRPMIYWIFSNPEYTELYHQYFTELLANTDIAAIIDEAIELITPYVAKDPTKFCTFEEFQTGVATLREFCLLRAESVSGQLNGTIPSTNEGQKSNSTTLIDASHINISDMGTMGGMGGKRDDMPMDFNKGDMPEGAAPGNMPTDGFDFSSRGDIDAMFPGASSSNADDKQSNPDNNKNHFPSGATNQNQRPQMPGMNPQQSTSLPTTTQPDLTVLIELAVSAVFLIVGLIVAFKFKRRR